MCDVCNRYYAWADRFEALCKEMWDYGADGDPEMPLSFAAISLAASVIRKDLENEKIDRMDAIHCLMDAVMIGPKHKRTA